MKRKSWGGAEVEALKWSKNPTYISPLGGDCGMVIVEEEVADKHMRWDSYLGEFWDRRLGL